MVHAHDHRPHCRTENTVDRAHPAWKLAIAAAWMVCAAMVVGISLIGPFITVLGPVVFISGASLLSWVYTRGLRDPQCTACGKLAYPVEDLPVIERPQPAELHVAA